MQIDLLPWKLVEVSMEVDGNFHGRRLRNQIGNVFQVQCKELHDTRAAW